MSPKEGKYQPNSEEIELGERRIIIQYESLLTHLSGLAPDFDKNRYQSHQGRLFDLSSFAVADISERVHKDKARFRHFHPLDQPDEFKVGGFFCYWIAKIRPIYFMDLDGEWPDEIERFLNEYLAIMTGFARANQKNRNRSHPPVRFFLRC